MTDVYASRDDLANRLGTTLAPGSEDRADLALIAGSRWVDERVSTDLVTDDVTPPYTLVVAACPAGWTLATLVVAVRFYRSAEAPFGVLGSGDMASYVSTSIPEAEIALFGHRVVWGIA